MVVAQVVAGSTLGGRYVVRRQIGRGGMAAVYLAYDPRLHLDVALKVLPPYVAADPTFVERFRREGQTLAALTHPYILRLYDLHEDEAAALYFLVLEHLTGGTLKDRLDGTPWSVADALGVLVPVAEALDFAHRRAAPVVHRDLKPANVLFGEADRVVVSDFGLARLLAPEGLEDAGQNGRGQSLHLSLSGGQVMGTPAYMAPEQAEGRAATPSSDLYALGVVAYELLTGTVPFLAETPQATLMQVLTRPLPLPSAVNPEIDAPVERVLLKALARDPSNRFSRARELMEALLAAGQLTVVSPPSSATSGARTREADEGTEAEVGHQETREAKFAPQQEGSADRSADTPGHESRQADDTLHAGAQPPVATANHVGSAAAPIEVAQGDASAADDSAQGGRRTNVRAVALLLLILAVAVAAVAVTSLGRIGSDKQVARATYTSASPEAPSAAVHGTAIATATPSPEIFPSPVPRRTPATDELWQEAEAVLDGAWARDWPAVLAALDAFRAVAPDHDAAKQKQYAALVDYGRMLEESGDISNAIGQWERARNLLEGRSEAPQLLRRLTPTPTATAMTPTPTPVPAGAATHDDLQRQLEVATRTAAARLAQVAQVTAAAGQTATARALDQVALEATAQARQTLAQQTATAVAAQTVRAGQTATALASSDSATATARVQRTAAAQATADASAGGSCVPSSQLANRVPGSWPIDPLFTDHYRRTNGPMTIGCTLSPPTLHNGVTVQYFEKGRLEDRRASNVSRNAFLDFQFGLLVDDLKSVRSREPVGGERSTITYDTIQTESDASRRQPAPRGFTGNAQVMADGSVFIPYATDLSPAPGHFVAPYFWEFMNRADLFPGGWLHDIGLPMTQALPAVVDKIRTTDGKAVRAVNVPVTVQAFQRTILVYDPGNANNRYVERANIGSNYVAAFPDRVPR